MRVFLVGPDGEGVSWRIQMHDGGMVQVYRRTGRAVSQTPLRRPVDMYQLGGWLLDRGLDITDLEEI